jgi:hypothetical protein
MLFEKGDLFGSSMGISRPIVLFKSPRESKQIPHDLSLHLMIGRINSASGITAMSPGVVVSGVQKLRRITISTLEKFCLFIFCKIFCCLSPEKVAPFYFLPAFLASHAETTRRSIQTMNRHGAVITKAMRKPMILRVRMNPSLSLVMDVLSFSSLFSLPLLSLVSTTATESTVVEFFCSRIDRGYSKIS